MKLPKKVYIGGMEWLIKIDPKVGGGCFDGGKAQITIGTKWKKDIPGNFLHEVLEAIITERCSRYKIYDETTNEKILFSFDHAEFVNIVTDLALALKNCLKS